MAGWVAPDLGVKDCAPVPVNRSDPVPMVMEDKPLRLTFPWACNWLEEKLMDPPVELMLPWKTWVRPEPRFSVPAVIVKSPALRLLVARVTPPLPFTTIAGWVVDA